MKYEGEVHKTCAKYSSKCFGYFYHLNVTKTTQKYSKYYLYFTHTHTHTQAHRTMATREFKRQHAKHVFVGSEKLRQIETDFSVMALSDSWVG